MGCLVGRFSHRRVRRPQYPPDHREGIHAPRRRSPRQALRRPCDPDPAARRGLGMAGRRPDAGGPPGGSDRRRLPMSPSSSTGWSTASSSERTGSRWASCRTRAPSGVAPCWPSGQRTDAQLRVLRPEDRRLPDRLDMSASIDAASARATNAHGELLGARKSIDAGRFFATETDVFYGKIIAADLQLPGVISASASPELAQRLQAEEALSTAMEYASHERDLVLLGLPRRHGQRGGVRASECPRGAATPVVAGLPAVGTGRALQASLDTKLAASDVEQLDRSRRHLTDLLQGPRFRCQGVRGLAQRRQPADRIDGRH